MFRQTNNDGFITATPIASHPPRKGAWIFKHPPPKGPNGWPK